MEVILAVSKDPIGWDTSPTAGRNSLAFNMLNSTGSGGKGQVFSPGSREVLSFLHNSAESLDDRLGTFRHQKSLFIF